MELLEMFALSGSRGLIGKRDKKITRAKSLIRGRRKVLYRRNNAAQKPRQGGLRQLCAQDRAERAGTW